MLYGFPTQTFRLHTLFAELLFHGLDLSAILVLTGIALSLWRRFRENTVARTLERVSGPFHFLPVASVLNDESSCRAGALPRGAAEN